MAGSILGTGWKFSLDAAPGLGLDPGARIAEIAEEECVRQAIWLILSTALGERVGRPDFGCGIHDLVFASASAQTMGDAVRAVETALTRWEPRIDVLRVDARPSASDPAELLVEVEYEVRATNSRFNLVYPFYLS